LIVAVSTPFHVNGITTKLYSVVAARFATVVEVPETNAPILVFTPATGACPLLLLKVNSSDGEPYNTTYPFAVAPEEGKEAAVHDKFTSLPEVGVAVNEGDAVKGGFESVIKLLSVDNPVP
jgi:hypothetical protein